MLEYFIRHSKPKNMKRVTASDLVLTLPEKEALFLTEAYTNADVILEYGSGGSTVTGAKLGKIITAVESDPIWANDMNRALYDAGLQHLGKVIFEDIGAVGKWGKPLNNYAFERYHNYPLAVWDGPSFISPDVILIDGRFRVACFVSALMRIQKPTLILFDDYKERSEYHIVERILEPTQLVGRMAIFHAVPNIDIKKHLTWMIGSFSKTTYWQRKTCLND